MNAARTIDVRSLHEQARQSDDKEAFTILAKMSDCRIGVGVRLASLAEITFFIEVLVSLCASQDRVDLDLMESKLSLLKRLERLEYVLNCSDDGCVSCELVVQSKDVDALFKDTYSEVEAFIKRRGPPVAQQPW